MRTFEAQKYREGELAYRVIAQDESEVMVMAESLDEAGAAHMVRVMSGLEHKFFNHKGAE